MKLVYADYGAYRQIDNTSRRKHNQNEAKLELEFEMRLNVASTTTTMRVPFTWLVVRRGPTETLCPPFASINAKLFRLVY